MNVAKDLITIEAHWKLIKHKLMNRLIQDQRSNQRAPTLYFPSGAELRFISRGKDLNELEFEVFSSKVDFIIQKKLMENCSSENVIIWSWLGFKTLKNRIIPNATVFAATNTVKKGKFKNRFIHCWRIITFFPCY